MTLHAHLSPLSIADYLEGELRSQVRHEYVAGRVFAMAGASETHNLIAGNLYTVLRAHLRGGGYRTFMSDMKVRVEKMQAFYYPDVLVTCDPDDIEQYHKSRPCLIIEVLSPATETIDRREKLLAYQVLDSLKEYVLVTQDRMQVEVYRRDGADGWWVDTYTGGEGVHLESVGLTLSIASVYEDVL
ncbi:MAG: Uma2 family endonuclease [Gammaproteobacteria bacterium]